MVNQLNSQHAIDLTGKRFAIVVSTYNESITGKLLQGAIEKLEEHRVAQSMIDVARVPGAWEIPLAASQLIASSRYVAVICLGAVIQGETTHDQHINRFVSLALGELSLKSSTPVSFGLLTCNDFEQAHARSGGKVGNKGHEATQAAIEMVGLLDAVGQL